MRQKNNNFHLGVAVVGFSSALGQSGEVRVLINTTITIIKNNDVNAGSADWSNLKNKALVKA